MVTPTFAFLFTDIEGSTSLLERLGEDAYSGVLAEHHGLIRRSLADHQGREIATQGDGFFAVFSSPRSCVAAVVAMQQALTAHGWPEGATVRVRMGVHAGEAAETVTGLVGYDVHRAARVAAVAHGGQVLLSSAAAELVREALPAGTSLHDLGMHRLKDLSHPEHIFQLRAAGLERDFPPLRSLDNPALPNNLPAQSSRFIGRQRELEELRPLVDSRRMVTLTGAGGSGKTRLALQAAAELLDGSGDGVWLVELAGVTGEEAVVPAIADGLGISVPPGRPVLEALVDALAPQHILVVLDNCEHLIGACAKIVDLLERRCPELHVLCTSREPLGISGEVIYRVPSLSLPTAEDAEDSESDAVALFLDRAAAQGITIPAGEDSVALMTSVCRRLDGMPLAIELAAARLRSLSLADLSDRLDQRFRLLTGGSRSALPRQQTLRATVDWSYSLLNDTEQAVLRRLSVFAEGFDLQAAEAVTSLADIEIFDITDLVSSLVDKSLMVAEASGGGVRYRLLETIRQFAAEHMVATSADEAVSVATAHRDYFLALAEEAAPHCTRPEQRTWLARLELESANLRRAIEHAVETPGGTKLVLRFATALRELWWIRGRTNSLESVLPVLDRPDAEDDPALLVGALVCAAICAWRQDGALARRLAARCLDLARRLDEPERLVEALWTSCAVSYFTGDREDGLRQGEEAVQLARRLGDDYQLATALAMFLLGYQLASYEEADYEAVLAEALGCARRAGDLHLVGLLMNNAACASLRLGALTKARSQLEEAERASPGFGLLSDTVAVNFAWVLRQEGDLDGAARRLWPALRSCRRSGDRAGLAYVVLAFAVLSGDRGNWEAAAALHGAAMALFDGVGAPCQEPEEGYRRQSAAEGIDRLGQGEWERLINEGRSLEYRQVVETAEGTTGALTSGAPTPSLQS